MEIISSQGQGDTDNVLESVKEILEKVHKHLSENPGAHVKDILGGANRSVTALIQAVRSSGDAAGTAGAGGPATGGGIAAPAGGDGAAEAVDGDRGGAPLAPPPPPAGAADAAYTAAPPPEEIGTAIQLMATRGGFVEMCLYTDRLGWSRCRFYGWSAADSSGSWLVTLPILAAHIIFLHERVATRVSERMRMAAYALAYFLVAWQHICLRIL